MANIAIFRINYKSDFILTLNSDAGWMTPFCIKFWTGAPSQAFFVGWDGETYTHCAYDPSEPTKLRVQFDDHRLPIGDLKFQIGYHFTVADFPTSVEDEVLNQASVIIEVDDVPAQVMLDLNGETAPEIAFSLPAYANEAQRIANEQQRIANEQTRIANEEARIAAETIRQQNEEQRIEHETARVDEFAQLKRDSEQATSDANTAANLANEKAQLAADKAALAQAAAALAGDKAQLADDKAALAQAAATLANEKAALAQQKSEYAQTQGNYANTQGDYAKNQGDYAKEQGNTAKSDHVRAEADHAAAADDHQTAAADHITATADHSTAASDHTRAEADHTTASSDHSRAESDHTTAESDHETAASDHTRAESDHVAVEVYVDSLGVFDLSKHNAVDGVLATYADLSAALTALNALDSKYKYGGMSFKFVHTSDNKYVQFRYMLQYENTTAGNNAFANTANWQGVDVTPTRDSNNFITSGAVAGQISKTNITAYSAGATPFVFKAGTTYHVKNNLTTAVTISHRNTPNGTSEDITSVPASEEIDYTPTTDGLYLRYGQTCNFDIWLKNSMYDYVKSVDEYVHSIDTILDNTPTKNSTHTVKSGGIYDAIDGEDAKIFVAENTLDRVEEGLQMEAGINLYDSSKQTPETISPHYYINGVPASTTQYDSQWNCTALIPIEPETQYTLCMVPHPTSYTKPWDGAAQGLFAYDKDGNYLNFMTTDNTFTTPKYARYIRFNYYIGGNITLAVLNAICMLVKGNQTPSEYEAYKTEFGALETLQDEIDATNEYLDDVIGVFRETAWELQTGTNDTGKYIGNDGSIAELDVYSVYLFNVSAGDIYRVKATYNTGGARRWAVYNSSTPSSSACTQLGGRCDENGGVYDDTITIGTGDVLLAITVYNNKPWVTTYKKVILDTLQDTAFHPIGYKIETNGIRISYKYGNGKDIMILMKAREHVNHLFDFDTFGMKDNLNPTPSINFSDFTTFYTGNTDWHAPFKLQALDDIDGDNINSETGQYNDFFTGGSHTYNNTADGEPTARLIGVEFYIDGKKRTSGNGLASHIEIRWSNAVQAQNTSKAAGGGREVLIEYHRMVFDGITFYEDIDLVPMEDILCKTWYGFQGVINGLYEAGLRYISSTNREEYATNIHSACGSKNCSGVIAHSATNGLEIEINEAIDLGKRDLTTGSGAFYEQSVKKVYMNIISNNNLTANYHYALNGSWRFFPV